MMHLNPLPGTLPCYFTARTLSAAPHPLINSNQAPAPFALPGCGPEEGLKVPAAPCNFGPVFTYYINTEGRLYVYCRRLLIGKRHITRLAAALPAAADPHSPGPLAAAAAAAAKGSIVRLGSLAEFCRYFLKVVAGSFGSMRSL